MNEQKYTRRTNSQKSKCMDNYTLEIIVTNYFIQCTCIYVSACTYIHIRVQYVELHVHLCTESSPQASCYFYYTKKLQISLPEILRKYSIAISVLKSKKYQKDDPTCLVTQVVKYKVNSKSRSLSITLHSQNTCYHTTLIIVEFFQIIATKPLAYIQ